MYKDKIKSTAELLKEVKKLKKRKKTVGFTNGCFDLLHAGHAKYLQDAKKKCDALIIAINSDSSVKKIKGEKRPINSQKARQIVIAALESVDFVVLFKETTPLKLIQTVKPDILIKGADWKKKDIVGAKEVSSNGGKIIRISFLKGYSTSAIIKKISSKI
ncbi:MAG: D-glycero-beta-D-manno-heptose 1-phosphate adenylyltransferase [Candidatus Kappaea frigidicola]|nr:D-glycero-beta-D-manno-heptose 1-phosphate adenylyltransferase [Candidatus Kappaea frigidicola]